MKNWQRRASDSIELQTLILELYKEARADGLFIIDRKKSDAFGIALREMETSYEANVVPFERFFAPANIKHEKRDMYEYSEKDIKKVEEFERFLKEIEENPPKDDIEAQEISLKITEKTDELTNVKPKVVQKTMPIYINTITGTEYPLIPLIDAKDDELEKLAQFISSFILHSKFFITGMEQRDPIMIEFVNTGEWADAFCI